MLIFAFDVDCLTVTFNKCYLKYFLNNKYKQFNVNESLFFVIFSNINYNIILDSTISIWGLR